MCVSQSVTFCLSPYTQDVCPPHGHGGLGGHGGHEGHGGIGGHGGHGRPKFLLTDIFC